MKKKWTAVVVNPVTSHQEGQVHHLSRAFLGGAEVFFEYSGFLPRSKNMQLVRLRLLVIARNAIVNAIACLFLC